jgi:DNA (cytosine-5)-methyltransferase 1
LTQQQIAAKTGYSLRTVYRWESGVSTPRLAVLEFLRKAASVPQNSWISKIRPPWFSFIDLFAGIGGMRLAFESVGGQCVFTSEWNEKSLQTYRANFPSDHPIVGDIRTVHESTVPPHHVLLAGFPCQPFSIAGVSKKNSLGRPHGFLCEAQGTLFFDIARIIDRKRPIAFVLENVKNLLSHDRGNTFNVIRKILENDLKYKLHVRVIDARYLVPQHRERIFLVGFQQATDFSFDNLEIPHAGPTLRTVLHSEDGSEPEEPPYTIGDNARVNPKYTLTPRLWEYLKQYAERHRQKGNGFGFGLVGPQDVARTLSARYFKDGSEILIRQRGRRPRRLTPRECARLMGFDRHERPAFRIPVSDTQAYRQFGNAVVVPVVESVARLMVPHLRQLIVPQQIEFGFNQVQEPAA